MVGTSLLTGGTLYVGYKAYGAVRDGVQPVWWRQLVTRLSKLRMQVLGESTPAPSVTPTIDLLPLPTPTAQHHLAVAVTSLAIATTSVLYFPPFQLLCVPAFVYLAIAPTQNAYLIWRQERRLIPTVAESVLLGLCLVQGSFLIGSAGFSLYYLGQVMADVQRKTQDVQAAWRPPLWAWRQSSEGEVVTLVSCLQVGDTVTVHSGEMVPLPGVITHGVAWVRVPGDPYQVEKSDYALGQKVGIGQQVAAATIVLVGAISVVVAVSHNASQ